MEGVVLKINSKGYNSRGGKSGLVYSFLLSEVSGNETWVTFGFDKEPPFEVGDHIAFEFTEKNGYKTYTEGTGRIIPKKPVGGGGKEGTNDAKSPGGNDSKTGGTGTASVPPVYPRTAAEADRQRQIVWQHSQEMAIAKIGLLLTHDGLPMSVAKTKAAQAQRYAEISAAVDKETVKFYNDVVTGRVLEHVADAGVVDTSAPDNIPPAGQQKQSEQNHGDEFQ